MDCLAGSPLLPQVLQRLMGNPPKYVRSGATIPALAAFQKHLNASTTVYAFGLPSGNLREWAACPLCWAGWLPAAAAAGAAAGAVPGHFQCNHGCLLCRCT